MGAIPTSDMPGHKKLHDRVCLALDRCQESAEIDFKESSPWKSLKWRLIKTAIGMGNLRDGGIVVIGASERRDSWDLTGMQADHLVTYDVDVMIDTFNAYGSPKVKVDIVLVTYRNRHKFLCIQIREFDDIPIVCKKNGNEGLMEGSVFIRPPAGRARTTRVMDASQMHDLIELAAEKRARYILNVSRRVGMVAKQGDVDLFEQELEGL